MALPRQLEYHTVDVFTNQQFGGNPLAVVLCQHPQALTSEEMQKVAREFHCQTTFILPPPSDDFTATLRIFTVGMELPFSGHANAGSAFVVGKLAAEGKKLFGKEISVMEGCVVFSEKAGAVRCQIKEERVTITAPSVFKGTENSTEISGKQVSECLSVSERHIRRLDFGGCGLPFLLAQVSSLSALEKCAPNPEKFKEHEKLLESGKGIHVYCFGEHGDKFDIRVRMFYHDLGTIGEDPATGSANCALVGFLASIGHPLVQGSRTVQITQGVEMGRPSSLLGQYLPTGQVSMSGNVVEVMCGTLVLN